MGNTINAVISLIFAKLLIHWCVDGMSHKNNFFTRLWSNGTHLLGGKEITCEMALSVSKPVEDIMDEMALCIPKPVKEITDEAALCISKPVKEITDKVAWGNLLPELCGEIGKRLVSRIDILRFRSVCKLWRSSLPSPTRFPLRVPPLPNCDLECQNLSYLISEINIYMLSKGRRILIEIEEVDQGNKFRGRYKYSEMSFKTSYLVHGLSQLMAVSKAYHFRTALQRSFEKVGECKGQWDFQEDALTRKTVIISQNPECVNPTYARLSDLMVVAHMSSGKMKGRKMKGRLALLRLRGSPDNWVWETDFCTTRFQDITTYKRQLCMLDLCGKVFLMDSNSFRITQVCDTSSTGNNLVHKHLFEAFGDLFVTGSLTERFESVDDLETYKFNLQLQKWCKAEGLDDIVINGRISVLFPFFAWKNMTRIEV